MRYLVGIVLCVFRIRFIRCTCPCIRAYWSVRTCTCVCWLCGSCVRVSSCVRVPMSVWSLLQVTKTDRGCYMCQINTAIMKKELGCISVQGEQRKISANWYFPFVRQWCDRHLFHYHAKQVKLTLKKTLLFLSITVFFLSSSL